ncbi:MAG TPA: hypothetical protein VNZ64_23125 [Candidatus Acidoferrum sp.]|jgi:hypothetical protein|nr:hypothetical protein [Candidatus Acidoferrum sp.]
MIAHESDRSQELNPNSETTTVTLHPLFTDGPDALDPHGAADIEQIKLHRLQYVEHNIFSQVTTKQADDLFAAAATDPSRASLMPADATATTATLKVKLASTPDPLAVELVPPATVNIEASDKAALILAWLANSVLNASRAVARVALILCLASAAAAAPALDDNDGDADDQDGDADRLHLRPRFHMSRPTLYAPRSTHHVARSTLHVPGPSALCPLLTGH